MKTDVGDSLLEKLRQEIDDNLTNDQFSVEALAKNIGMSRSQLHRKLSSLTGQSISQFVREHRLQVGMDLLSNSDLTAAEVADRVGFGSASYFSKCFAEYYGFPPGEVRHREAAAIVAQEEEGTAQTPPGKSYRMIRIAASLLVFALAIIGVFHLYETGLQKNEPQTNDAIRGIAILPFRNLTGDKNNEYFSEGIVEAIRTNVSRISDLRVISRISVEQYRNGTKPARVIARELGVQGLLEGSIQRSNNQVRIDVRLVDGVTEENLWAKSFDRELSDVFAIQSEIAHQVAIELHATLAPERDEFLSRQDTDNPKAYDLYLKGVYEYRTYTNAGAHNAIHLLSQAIALDSGYARAYAFLANSYFGLATIWGAELDARLALEKGWPFLSKALHYDPRLDEGHMLMGFYRLYHDWDFENCEAAYKLGIVNNHADAIAMYIDFLNFMQRHKEALALARKLDSIDPYYPNSRMVYSLVYNGLLTEALSYSEKRQRLFTNYNTYDAHGFLLMHLNRYEEAISAFGKAIALEGKRYPRILGWMGASYARSGKSTEAMKIVEELRSRLNAGDGTSLSFFIAVIYSAMGETESALKWLRQSVEHHDMEIPWLISEPQFYPLHGNPDFRLLAKEVGFTSF